MLWQNLAEVIIAPLPQSSLTTGHYFMSPSILYALGPTPVHGNAPTFLCRTTRPSCMDREPPTEERIALAIDHEANFFASPLDYA